MPQQHAEMLVGETVAQVTVDVGDQRRHAVGHHAQALLAGGDLLLVAHPLGDVVQEGGGVPGAGVAHRADRQFDRYAAPVLVHGGDAHAGVDRRPPAAAREVQHAVAVGVALVRRHDQLGDVAADGFVAPPAECVLGGGVPLGDGAVGVAADERVRRMLKNAADQRLAVADGLLRRLALGHQVVERGAEFADFIAVPGAVALQHADVGAAAPDGADVAVQGAQRLEQRPDRQPRHQAGDSGEHAGSQHGVAAHRDHRCERLVDREAGADDPVGRLQVLVRVNPFAAVLVARLGPALEAAQRHLGGVVVAGAGVDVLQQPLRIRMVQQDALPGHDEQEAGLAGLLRADLFEEHRVGQVDAAAQQHRGAALRVAHRLQNHDRRLAGLHAPVGRRDNRLAGGQRVFQEGAGARIERRRGGGVVALGVQQRALLVEDVQVEEFATRHRVALDEGLHGGRIGAGRSGQRFGQAASSTWRALTACPLRGDGRQHGELLVADHRLHVALRQHQRHQRDDQGRAQHQHDHHHGHAELEATR
ncbi:conserved hypothetical protein [Ricinus communis]|uniref:Uncharacterized protein n=1 Tax=Ricinus communis TaxID=3988 RepID=B9TAX8_RICCO|nr:conserved hypothetical protein [Ricinus communis]